MAKTKGKRFASGMDAFHIDPTEQHGTCIRCRQPFTVLATAPPLTCDTCAAVQLAAFWAIWERDKAAERAAARS